MKKIYLLSLSGFLLMSIFGCSDSGDSAKDSDKTAPKAKIADAHTLISCLALVPSVTITANTRNSSANTIEVVENLKALKQVTGVEFYARAPRDFDANSPTGKALGARSAKFLPFFAEDVITNTIYIAPSSVQNAIIAQWRDWAIKNPAKALLAPTTSSPNATVIRQDSTASTPDPKRSTSEVKKTHKPVPRGDISELLLD